MDRYGKSENILMCYELINSLKTWKVWQVSKDRCLEKKKKKKKWISFCETEFEMN